MSTYLLLFDHYEDTTMPETRPLVVYLAGPISGCSDAEATAWRERVKAAFAYEVRMGFLRLLDPMRRDYRGREDECVSEIVESDIDDIRRADILLVAHPRPSTGTDMEIRLAKAELGKVVIVWSTEERPSPWLRYHADMIVDSLASALIEVRSRIDMGREAAPEPEPEPEPETCAHAQLADRVNRGVYACPDCRELVRRP